MLIAWVGMKFGINTMSVAFGNANFLCFAVTQILAKEIAITSTLNHHSVFRMYTWQLLYLISELPYIYIILGTVCVVHFVT